MTNTTEHSDYIPIIRRNGLFLYWIDGDGPRFARLFAETWRQLPLWARRRILRYWRETHPRTSNDTLVEVEPPWPHIELLADKSDFHWRGNSKDAMAQTVKGKLFAFKSSVMDTMPDAEVLFTIAHELAHAFYFAGDDIEEHFSDPEWADIEADELADLWGFDRDDGTVLPATLPVV